MAPVWRRWRASPRTTRRSSPDSNRPTRPSRRASGSTGTTAGTRAPPPPPPPPSQTPPPTARATHWSENGELTIAPRDRLRDRLAARVDRHRLDAALVAGAPPEASARLALRARGLTGPQ